MKEVSIIIVNYNTKDLLQNCIRSILEKTQGVSFEIIVVDNNSSDRSVELIRKEFPEVVFIELKENMGFGKANNIGMSKASGKYLFLLNSDTVLINNAVGNFYNTAEALANQGIKLGVLGSILKTRDMTGNCHSYGRFITPSFEIKEILAKYLRFLKDTSNTNPSDVDGIKAVDYVTGADMFLPKTIFEKTSGFDPDFFMYCEEVDWQKRMSMLGYERFIIPGPAIIHLEGGGDGTKNNVWSPSRLINLYKSRKIYRKKHYSSKLLPFFRLCLLLLDLPSILMIAFFYRQKEYLQLIKLK